MTKKPVTVEELADYALITDATSYNELDGTPTVLAEEVFLTDVTYFDDSSEVDSSTEGAPADTPSAGGAPAENTPADTPSAEGTPAEDTTGDS